MRKFLGRSRDKVVNFSTDNWKRYREYSNYYFWEVHEAVFMLIGWPDDRGEDFIDKYDDRFDFISLSPDLRQEIRRDSILVWNHQEKYLKQLGDNFKKVLSALKDAIERGELRPRRERVFSNLEYYGSKTLVFLSVKDLIIWCMFNSFALPDRLQSELGIYQIPGEKSISQARQNSVKNRIVAQYIIGKNPKLSITDICNHSLMNSIGTGGQSCDKEKKSIRNAVASILEKKRQAGRPPNDPSKAKVPKYVPKAISDVIQKDAMGLSRYNFQLFRIAMITAAEVQLELLGRDSIFEMTENDFLKAFLEDSIVQMYLMNESEIPKYFATKFALEVLHCRYFHPRSLLMPAEERNELRISQIWTIHNLRADQIEILDPSSDNGRFAAAIYWRPPK